MNSFINLLYFVQIFSEILLKDVNKRTFNEINLIKKYTMQFPFFSKLSKND